jgi:hypothetical protein
MHPLTEVDVFSMVSSVAVRVNGNKRNCSTSAAIASRQGELGLDLTPPSRISALSPQTRAFARLGVCGVPLTSTVVRLATTVTYRVAFEAGRGKLVSVGLTSGPNVSVMHVRPSAVLKIEKTTPVWLDELKRNVMDQPKFATEAKLNVPLPLIFMHGVTLTAFANDTKRSTQRKEIITAAGESESEGWSSRLE